VKDLAGLASTGQIQAEVAALLAVIDRFPFPPIAIEGLWDGDTGRPFARLLGVVEQPGYDHGRYSALKVRTYGSSDAAPFFGGKTPAHPEGHLVSALGKWLSRTLEVPFHFESPAAPVVEPSRWWDGRPPPPPAEWEVLWQRIEVADDGTAIEDAGRSLETARTPKEAHRRVIERYSRQYDAAGLQQRGIQKVELRVALIGLLGGHVEYRLRLTPTSYEAWGS